MPTILPVKEPLRKSLLNTDDGRLLMKTWKEKHHLLETDRLILRPFRFGDEVDS